VKIKLVINQDGGMFIKQKLEVEAPDDHDWDEMIDRVTAAIQHKKKKTPSKPPSKSSSKKKGK